MIHEESPFMKEFMFELIAVNLSQLPHRVDKYWVKMKTPFLFLFSKKNPINCIHDKDWKIWNERLQKDYKNEKKLLIPFCNTLLWSDSKVFITFQDNLFSVEEACSDVWFLGPGSVLINFSISVKFYRKFF